MNLTLADFVLIVLLGSAGLVLLLSLASRLMNARAERRALGRRVICRLCLNTFEVQSGAKVVECPACGALTESGR